MYLHIQLSYLVLSHLKRFLATTAIFTLKHEKGRGSRFIWQLLSFFVFPSFRLFSLSLICTYLQLILFILLWMLALGIKMFLVHLFFFSITLFSFKKPYPSLITDADFTGICTYLESFFVLFIYILYRYIWWVYIFIYIHTVSSRLVVLDRSPDDEVKYGKT